MHLAPPRHGPAGHGAVCHGQRRAGARDAVEVAVVADSGHRAADRGVDVAFGQPGAPQGYLDGFGEKWADLDRTALSGAQRADFRVRAKAAARDVQLVEVGGEHGASLGEFYRVRYDDLNQGAEGAPAGRSVCCAGSGPGAGLAFCGGLAEHYEPPEVVWLLPELEVGVEPELRPLEDEPEVAEPELVEPELVEPELVEPELVEPEPVLVDPELVDPVLAEPEEVPVDVDVSVLCVVPGRTRASAPAVTTLAMVTAVVVDLTLLRPRSRSATARWILSRCALMYPILRSGTRGSLYESSLLAMSRPGSFPRWARGYVANMKET
jgi:hypothetical protein